MLKKIKSLFVVDGESTNTPEQEADFKESGAKKDQTSQAKPTVKSNPNAKPSKKFVDLLFKAFESENLEGFDYIEFKQSLKSLDNVPMDEATKFKSAFAMAQSLGASKPKILSSANHYIKILDNEKQKFESAYQQRTNSQNQDSKDNETRLKSLIAAKKTDIRKLQKEIDTHEKELGTVTQSNNQAIAKAQLTRDKFMAAYTLVVSQIQNDVKNITKHLSK